MKYSKDTSKISNSFLFYQLYLKKALDVIETLFYGKNCYVNLFYIEMIATSIFYWIYFFPKTFYFTERPIIRVNFSEECRILQIFWKIISLSYKVHVCFENWNNISDSIENS